VGERDWLTQRDLIVLLVGPWVIRLLGDKLTPGGEKVTVYWSHPSDQIALPEGEGSSLIEG